KSPAQIAEIKKQYQAHYKSDLTADLKDELSGDDLQRAMSLMRSNQAAAAATVLKGGRDAWFGGAGDILGTLEQAGPRERVKIAEAYAQKYGKGQKGPAALSFMSGQLRGKLGAEDSRRLDALMDGARAADNPALAAKYQAKADAQKIQSELNSTLVDTDTIF